MTLTELARATDLPKSTVHRLLARLVELDVVEHIGEGYRISLSLIRLASLSPANLMRDLALPHMARLHNWSGHTVSLGVLRDFDTVVLEQVGSVSWHSDPFQVGARIPAHSSVLGKVLLAWDPREALESLLPNPLQAVTSATITDRDELIAQLREIRATNLASQVDESLEGISGIGSAILIKGEAVGAIAIVHPTTVRLAGQATHALRGTAAQLATEISDRLTALGQQKRWMPGREITEPSIADDDQHQVT